MNAEQNEIEMLRDASVHEVISVLIHTFIRNHKVQPELIFLNNNLRMQFTIELINRLGLTPEEAVIEPVWIKGFGRSIPLLYSSGIGDDYVRLLNKHSRVSDTL